MSGLNTFPSLYTKEDADHIQREVQAAVAARRPLINLDEAPVGWY